MMLFVALCQNLKSSPAPTANTPLSIGILAPEVQVSNFLLPLLYNSTAPPPIHFIALLVAFTLIVKSSADLKNKSSPGLTVYITKSVPLESC